MWLWIERRSADPGRGFRYPSVIAVAAPTCEAALAAGKARRGRRRDRGEEYVTSATTGTVAAAWFAERGARTEALRAELPRAAVLAAFDDDGPVETTAELICRLRPDEALSMAAIGRLVHGPASPAGRAPCGPGSCFSTPITLSEEASANPVFRPQNRPDPIWGPFSSIDKTGSSR